MVSSKPGVRLFLMAAAVCLAGYSMGANAGVATWTFTGVTFADGGTASGSFDYDSGFGTVSNWSVMVSGGDTGTFPVFTYDTTTSTGWVSSLGNPQNTIVFEQLASNRQLRFTPVAALTDAGGTIALNLATAGGGSGGVECYNCTPFRLINGGSLQSPGAPAVDLVKLGALDLGGDGIANPGDVINYTFTVNNTGYVALPNVAVTDPMISPVACPSGNPIPSLAAAASEICTGSHVITQADIDAGLFVNFATATTGDPVSGPPVSDADGHTESVPQVLSLDLVKDGALDLGGDGSADPGDMINYTFMVTNTGNVSLSNVAVTDPLISPIVCPSGNPIPSLAPSAGQTCTGSYAITQADINAGSFFNTATATGDPPSGPPVTDTDSHTEAIPQGASVTGTKQGPVDQPPVGATVTYTVVLANAGPGVQNDNPGDEFVDVLPPQLTLTGAQIISGGGTVVADTGTNTVTWNGSIPVGGQVEIEITATINPDAAGQLVTNQGQISYDDNGDGANGQTALTQDSLSGGPTLFQVQQQSIPTLGGLGLVLLLIGLVGAGIMRLRYLG